MTNEQLIKTGHVWGLAILLAFGLTALAVSPASLESQNSNSQNSNQSNRNSNNSQNRNDNRSSSSSKMTNANMSGAAMAGMKDDQKFVTEAAMGGMMEVELGRLATQQGASEAVKKLGQTLIDDHTKANEELKQLATTKGITLPTELDMKHKNELARMAKMTGADFDKAFAKMSVSDHVKDVAAFEKQSTKGTDADIKAFAAKTLPTLQQHLQMSRAINGEKGMGSNKNGNSNMNRNGNGNSNNSNN